MTLKVQTTDRYGRTVANCSTIGECESADGGAGHASPIGGIRQCDAQKYLQLEADAKQQGRGVIRWTIGHHTALGLPREDAQFIKFRQHR